MIADERKREEDDDLAPIAGGMSMVHGGVVPSHWSWTLVEAEKRFQVPVRPRSGVTGVYGATIETLIQ